MSEYKKDLQDTFNSLSLDSNTKNFLDVYYVKRKSTEIQELLTSLKIKTQPTRILFSGHRGSGKTSELRYLRSELESKPIITIFVSTIKDLNISDVSYTDILLAIVDNIINLLEELKIELDETIIEHLKKLLLQLSGELSVDNTKTNSYGYGFRGFFVAIGA